MICFLFSFGFGLLVGWLVFKRPAWAGWIVEWVKARVTG